MKRLLSRIGLLSVFVMATVAGQVFFASAAYAAENPSFDWEESYTADNKLGENQLTWCSANLDGETTADLANFRSGASGTYVNECLNASVGGICKTVENGANEEFRCYRSIPDDHPLVLAIKAAEKDEVGPLQVLYCGTPNMANADTLISCQQAVSGVYFSPKCFYANQKDSKLGRSSARDAADCVHNALRNNNKIINKNRTQAQVLDAIRQGRKAANKKIQAAIKEDQARLQCIDDGGTWENGSCVAEGDDGSGTSEPVCSAGALGWVICPLTDFISDATQTIAEIIEDQLVYPPLLDSDQGNAIRTVWGTVLGIANLGLVIAFLIIIFSQATSVGLSSYGIKKILPRIIAAAILMNLSFFLCAIAVDLANILGVSIKGIVQAGIESIDKAAPASDLQSADGTSWAAGVVGILALGVAAFTGTIAFLLPVILAALIAVFTAFLVIAARGVIVTLLIIVAPLAFLAWILPNTEQWFTKWRKLFTTMLLMFPLVMIVFYGSLLVSRLVLVTTAGGGDGDPKIMTNIIALAILTVPLFSLPFIMKSAGGVLDRLGIIANNRSKGLVDRSRKAANTAQKNSRFSNALAFRRENRELSRVKRRGRDTTYNRAVGAAGGPGYNAYTQRKAYALEEKEFEQAVSDAATGQKSTAFDSLKDIARDPHATEYERVAAARAVMAKGNFEDRKTLYDHITPGSSERMRQTVSEQYYAKGDSSVLGAAFGGELLKGTSGGDPGARQAAASYIKAGKVTPQALVQDSGSTDLLLDVAQNASAYGITQQHLDGLAKAASETMANEATRVKAAAPIYAAPLSAISQLGSSPPPTPPTTGPSNGGSPPPPSGSGGGSGGSSGSGGGSPTPAPSGGGGSSPSAPSGSSGGGPVPAPPAPGSLSDRIQRAQAARNAQNNQNNNP